MGNGSFAPKYIEELRLHPSIGWALAHIGEARGLQEVWRKTKPEVIAKLRESALVQSSESSNRIEGVEVEPSRLVPLILGAAKPKDRPEEEIVGYRNALKWIHSSHQKIKISPATVKKLHKLAQGGLISDAGEWKSRDNEIVEFSRAGDRRIRFRCTPASETPRAMAKLCESYSDMQEKKILPDLLAVSNFILDFLCIHPFRDGNGRVSRLLTLLCLYQQGYEIGRFISLERIIENTKEDYYRTLAESSADWHSSKHDLFPWWSYFLGHLRSGYQELKDRVDLRSGDSKTALIRGVVKEMDGPFSVSDVLKLQPGLDREIVKKALAQLKREKVIRLTGKGRGAKWRLT
jgi:Fic family protein